MLQNLEDEAQPVSLSNSSSPLEKSSLSSSNVDIDSSSLSMYKDVIKDEELNTNGLSDKKTDNILSSNSISPEKIVNENFFEDMFESKLIQPHLNVMKRVMDIAGKILIFVEFIALIYNFYIFFNVLLPMVFGELTFLYYFHFFLGIYITISIIVNFIMVVKVGRYDLLKPDWKNMFKLFQESNSQSNNGNKLNLTNNAMMRQRASPSSCVNPLNSIDLIEEKENNQQKEPKRKIWSKECKRCLITKPVRTHHCHLCNTCIHRMDHHCPFLHTCIGFANYRYFLLFLCYLWFAAFYNLLLTSLSYFNIIPHNNEIFENYHYRLLFHMFETGVISFSFGIFSLFHIYLTCTNQTTIEFQFYKLNSIFKKPNTTTSTMNSNNTNRYQDVWDRVKFLFKSDDEQKGNLYDIGVWNNIQQSLGKAPEHLPKALGLLYLILPFPLYRKYPTDGTYYPTGIRKEELMV
ncbi:hypothetical protein ABK040_013353 [Willaertia magna]